MIGGFADALFALAALLIGAAVVWITGKRIGRKDEQAKQDKEELAAHDRINNADTGAGLSDADRRKRLRDFADKHRN